eukprot:TRINITY_DN18351_c0_g1_i2.p2 TRINITY_DN18351_c0_g1~~TRINITY_DN18351_c0_g1_i2.p2  ORF type:complete len:106 (+),score=34.19 TRINITY_DN18351_c0_g1_i2:64-381(+)
MQYLVKAALLMVCFMQADARLWTANKAELTAAAEAPIFGLVGEACGDDAYKRYKTIVCGLREACGCTETLCAQDWCNGYMRKWKKEFGACTAKGCPVSESEAAAA